MNCQNHIWWKFWKSSSWSPNSVSKPSLFFVQKIFRSSGLRWRYARTCQEKLFLELAVSLTDLFPHSPTLILICLNYLLFRSLALTTVLFYLTKCSLDLTNHSNPMLFLGFFRFSRIQGVIKNDIIEENVKEGLFIAHNCI